MITLHHADIITANTIRTLHREFQPRVWAWFEECKRARLAWKPYIYCGHRSCEEQAKLFARGPLVTRAAPGQSFHNYGFAFDWVPLLPHDRAAGMWVAAWDSISSYKAGQAIATRHQLVPLKWERPHLQAVEYQDYKALQKRFGKKCS